MAEAAPAGTGIGEMVATTLLGEAVAAGSAAAFLCDDDLGYVAANDAACALVGYRLDELLKMRVDQIVVAPEERLRAAAREVTAGLVRAGRSLLRPKEGDPVEVAYLSEPTRLGALGSFVFTLCWPVADGDRASGRAGG